MPLEELMKLYNYGGAAAAPPEAPEPDKKSDSAPSQERLRDVRPDKLKADKNGVTKTKLADVSIQNELKTGDSKPGMCGTDGKKKDIH
jgi:hypothetical protein